MYELLSQYLYYLWLAVSLAVFIWIALAIGAIGLSLLMKMPGFLKALISGQAWKTWKAWHTWQTWKTWKTIDDGREYSYSSRWARRRQIIRSTILLWLERNPTLRAALLCKRGYAYYWGRSSLLDSFNRAIADYSEAIRLDPNNADAFLGRGIVKTDLYDSLWGYLGDDIKEKNLKQLGALDDFNKAILLAPGNAKFYSYRAKFYSKFCNFFPYREANFWPSREALLSDYSRVIELDSLNPEYRLARAMYLANPNGSGIGVGNVPIEAISDFNEAIQLDPQNDLQNAVWFHCLAEIYWSKDDFDKATSNFSQAIRKISLTNNKSLTASFLSDRGHLYERMGDLHSAIADYSEAINVGGSYALQARAEAYQKNSNYDLAKNSNYDLAIADYNRILGRFPHRGQLGMVYRANLYVKKGDLSRAIADLDKHIHKYKKRPGQFAQRFFLEFAFYTRGFAYNLRGDLDRAVADYSESIRRAPRFVAALVRRGELYEKRGELRLALADFDTACAPEDFDHRYVYDINRTFLIDRTFPGGLDCPDAAQARERLKAALDRQNGN